MPCIGVTAGVAHCMEEWPAHFEMPGCQELSLASGGLRTFYSV